MKIYSSMHSEKEEQVYVCVLVGVAVNSALLIRHECQEETQILLVQD